MTAAQRTDAGGTNDLWHYAVGSERKGPVPRTTIAKLLASGEISAETYVWQPGMDNWVHLVDAAPLKPLVAGLEGDGQPEEFVEEDTAFTSPADLKAVHTALDDDDSDLSGDTIVEAIPDMSKGAAAPAVQETGPRGTQKSPKKGGQPEAKQPAKAAAPAAKAEPMKAEPAKQLATTTMAAQPAPAPAKKDSGLFSNVSAPAAAASNDIFGGGGAADDDIFGSSAPASEGEEIAGVHGRRQSSVLFSLDELGREEKKGGGGKAGGNEQFVTDSSGLIDIKAIATNEKRGSSGDDPFGASAPNLVLPARTGPAAMTIPIVERKRGNGPWILAAAALLVIGGAIVAFILASGGEKDVPNVPLAANEPTKTEPAKPAEVAQVDKKPDEAKAPTEAKVEPATNPTTPPPTEAKVEPPTNPTTPPPTEVKVEPATNPALVAKKDEPKKDVKKDEPKKDEPKKDEPKKDEVKKDEPKKDEPKKDTATPNKENTTKVNDLLNKLNSGETTKKDEGGGDSTLPDKLSAATVRNTIKGRFGRCGGMISNPSGSVTVQTQFVISSSGVVQSARVSDGGGTSPDVQRCVVSVIKETTFGKFKEPTMQVNLPVRLL